MRVLHLTGSPTDAFSADLSRVYAAGCLSAIREQAEGDVHVVADVQPDGTWRIADDVSAGALEATDPVPVGHAVAHLDALALDVAVPQLFCRAGLTSYRGLLDVLGIPSVGNSAATMALTLDKARTRAVVAAAGVAVPEGEVVAVGGRPSLTPPVVVKPVAADNSAGVTLVRDPAALDEALATAWGHGGPALVETYVPAGREVRCGTVRRGDAVVALPLEEYPVDAAAAPIRGVADKLARDDAGALRLTAKGEGRAWIVDPEDPVTAPAQAVAVTAHHALGCAHHGLVDLRVDPDGRPWFLEAGPYCSFSPDSVIPTMARAAGIDLRTLFDEAVALALAGARPSATGAAADPTVADPPTPATTTPPRSTAWS